MTITPTTASSAASSTESISHDILIKNIIGSTLERTEFGPKNPLISVEELEVFYNSFLALKESRNIPGNIPPFPSEAQEPLLVLVNKLKNNTRTTVCPSTLLLELILLAQNLTTQSEVILDTVVTYTDADDDPWVTRTFPSSQHDTPAFEDPPLKPHAPPIQPSQRLTLWGHPKKHPLFGEIFERKSQQLGTNPFSHAASATTPHSVFLHYTEPKRHPLFGQRLNRPVSPRAALGAGVLLLVGYAIYASWKNYLGDESSIFEAISRNLSK